MRKLATICKIDSVNPIEGADAIDVLTVGGWKVVARKGDYVTGDLAVYCEIDSWIPTELAPFLSNGDEKSWNGVVGNRLRTIKLRGQLSQGLLLKIPSIVPEGCEVGTDVTELLGIQKWEAPVPAQLSGEAIGLFPSAVPKTDQERIQNLTQELNDWKDLEFEVTEKLDGSSCTIYLGEDGDFHVCSRNLDLRESDNNTFWKVTQQYGVEQKMTDLGLYGLAIQGELIGEGIQGNPYKLKGQDLFVFDVYDTVHRQYLDAEKRIELCNTLGLKHVPVLTDSVSYSNLEVTELLMLAEGKSVLNTGSEREGLVFKCVTDPSIHFKAISNKFLLKER